MKKFLSKIDGSSAGKTFVLQRYQVVVEETIAEGGFGVVYLVRASGGSGLGGGQRFALKRILVNNEHDLALCRKEIELNKALSGHKNIVRYLDSRIGALSGQEGVYEALLLQQYYRDNVIEQLSRRVGLGGGLSESEVLRIMCDMCEAVSKLHSLTPPVIHRDLKVENILYDDTTCSYVLCDFGSCTSQILSAKDQQVKFIEDELQRCTTVSYRSPEMVDLYSNQPITTKSDIWSLGCLLYRLCFISLPFGESVLAIPSGLFTVPDTHQYSKHLIALIKYMLTVDPDTRPDIYQVSYLTFQLSNKSCPVRNTHGSRTVDIGSLPVPMTESEAKRVRKSNTNSNTAVNNSTITDSIHQVSTKDSTTSVRPRQRPRSQMLTSSELTTPQSNYTSSAATSSAALPAPNQKHASTNKQVQGDSATSAVKAATAAGPNSCSNAPVTTAQQSQANTAAVDSEANQKPLIELHGSDNDFDNFLIQSQPTNNDSAWMTAGIPATGYSQGIPVTGISPAYLPLSGIPCAMPYMMAAGQPYMLYQPGGYPVAVGYNQFQPVGPSALRNSGLMKGTCGSEPSLDVTKNQNNEADQLLMSFEPLTIGSSYPAHFPPAGPANRGYPGSIVTRQHRRNVSDTSALIGSSAAYRAPLQPHGIATTGLAEEIFLDPLQRSSDPRQQQKSQQLQQQQQLAQQQQQQLAQQQLAQQQQQLAQQQLAQQQRPGYVPAQGNEVDQFGLVPFNPLPAQTPGGVVGSVSRPRQQAGSGNELRHKRSSSDMSHLKTSTTAVFQSLI